MTKYPLPRNVKYFVAKNWRGDETFCVVGLNELGRAFVCKRRFNEATGKESWDYTSEHYVDALTAMACDMPEEIAFDPRAAYRPPRPLKTVGYFVIGVLALFTIYALGAWCTR